MLELSAQPFFILDGSQPGLSGGHQCRFTDLGAIVRGMAIRHYLARIILVLQISGDNLRHSKPFRTSYLCYTVDRRIQRSLGYEGGYIFSSYRLELHIRDMHHVSFGSLIRDACQELEELCAPDD